MASVCQVFMLLCFTSGLMIGEARPRATGCPPGWTQKEVRCFLYVQTGKTWTDAESDCQSRGGNLASIQNACENSFLAEEIRRISGRFDTAAWIGGFDAVKEGVWMWVDGTKFGYSAWLKGQPDNHKNEHCVAMNWGGKDMWNDSQCFRKRPYVCAKDM